MNTGITKKDEWLFIGQMCLFIFSISFIPLIFISIMCLPFVPLFFIFNQTFDIWIFKPLFYFTAVCATIFPVLYFLILLKDMITGDLNEFLSKNGNAKSAWMSRNIKQNEEVKE